MISVPVYSMDGEATADAQVDEARLGGTVNQAVLRQAILAYEANRRAGTAKTKTRAEVSYSGRKPWRQKHTGRARAGTRASPVWRGGGVALGPRPRDHSQKLNRKMRCRALASALLAKLQAGEVKVIERLELREAKTKEMAQFLKNLGVERAFLLVLPAHDPVLWRCTRNIPGAAMMTVDELNAYEVLRARHVLFTKDSFDQVFGVAREPGRSASAEDASGAEGE